MAFAALSLYSRFLALTYKRPCAQIELSIVFY